MSRYLTLWQTDSISGKQNAFVLSLVALVFVMPFPMVLQNMLFPVVALLWLLQGKSIRSAFTHEVTWWLFAFWLIHVLSAFNSDNQKEAWHIVERRLPLLAFPLFFIHPLVQQFQGIIKKAFVFGVLSACASCLITAVVRYTTTGNLAVFFYHPFAEPIKMHAVYLAVYCLMSLVLVETSDEWFKFKRAIQFILLCFIVLLNSKLCIVLTILLGIHSFVISKVGTAKRYITALVILVSCLFLLSLIPLVKQRFSLEFNTNLSVITQQKYAYNTPFTGSSLRVVIWKKCIETLNEYNAWVIGVGTGDYQDILNQKYRACGMYTGNPALHDTGYLGYGPHNQYVEILLSMGILGLMFFLALLARISMLGYGNKTWLYFLLICVLFFITESVLSTNKGVTFFSLFVCLLWVNLKTDNFNFVKKN